MKIVLAAVLPLALDTGANLSVIDPVHAALFGLTAGRGGPRGATGIGGSNAARHARIESLAFGSSS